MIGVSWLEAQWRWKARQLARSSEPILIGPWRSEVGFEVLYWIPFLHRFRKAYGIDKARLIAIGRGGSHAWYDCAGYGDLYEHLPVDAVRTLSLQASQQTGSLKQRTEDAWEQHVCALVAASVGIRRYQTLSPSWMYQLCRPWWDNEVPIGYLDRYTLQPARLPIPPLPPALAGKLPAQYLAMRWYARATWPLREDLILWTRTLVEQAARRMPVVIVDSGLHTDDHADIHLGRLPNVVRLSELAGGLDPLTNLATQSAVIARSRGYVGTYGGLAQGAVRWGIPTLALYDSFGHTSPQHLILSQMLSLQSGVPFVCTHPQAVDVLLPLLVQTEAAVYG